MATIAQMLEQAHIELNSAVSDSVDLLAKGFLNLTEGELEDLNNCHHLAARARAFIFFHSYPTTSHYTPLVIEGFEVYSDLAETHNSAE